MTKVKLSNGTIVNASDVEVVNGVLKISTTDFTVEELAELFSNKENTSLIVLLTESDVESGYKTGFTSFAGINYNANEVKTVELFQPKDVTESRLAKAEGTANLAKETSDALTAKTTELEETVNALLGTEVVVNE